MADFMFLSHEGALISVFVGSILPWNISNISNLHRKNATEGDPAWEGKPRLRNLTLMFVWGVLLNQNLIFTTMARLQLDSLNFRWLETCRTTQFGRENPSSLKLTYAPGKMTGWKMRFPFWGPGLMFRGDMGDMLVFVEGKFNDSFVVHIMRHEKLEDHPAVLRLFEYYADSRCLAMQLQTWRWVFRQIHQMLYFYCTCCTWTYWLC